MLYYENLEEIIFNKHEYLNEPDELVIISGYLGVTPVRRLRELPLKTTVIGGMYSQGINKKLLDSLVKEQNQNERLSLKFTNLDIHSKIYIWKKENKIQSALIGSANFSRNGLCSDLRESLADATSDTFKPLDKYLSIIEENSTTNPKVSEKSIIDEYELTQESTTPINLKFKYDIPLFITKKGVKEVPKKSGLNWCLSDGHVAKGDAYIPIPKSLLLQNQGLIPPFRDDYISSGRKRQSDPIELIWDDGTIMEASLEGLQKEGCLRYPKQIASYSSKSISMNGERISAKSILGRYIRKRLNVDLETPITMEILENYGRTSITLSLVENGVYFADFSV
ncbi:NgoFVII family restriction endonuclease [Gallibacterium anatis]|uniref:restriction endonuclease PLD domain-containing protein n=1 Tax=Gallibacterium anatis TaxID=750 RepID=UPI0038D3A238